MIPKSHHKSFYINTERHRKRCMSKPRGMTVLIAIQKLVSVGYSVRELHFFFSFVRKVVDPGCSSEPAHSINAYIKECDQQRDKQRSEMLNRINRKSNRLVFGSYANYHRGDDQ